MTKQVAQGKAQPPGSSSSIGLPSIDWPSIDSVWVGTGSYTRPDWLVPVLAGTATAALVVVAIAFGVVA